MLIDRNAIRDLKEARRQLKKEWSRETLDRWYAALDRIWNPQFKDAYCGARKGDFTFSKTLIQFLEEDPIFFRSGYVKEDILQRLRPEVLSKKEIARLRLVCIRAVDVCNRREYRRYCRLAARIADAEVVKALDGRINSADGQVRSRARMMINAIARHGPPALAKEIDDGLFLVPTFNEMLWLALGGRRRQSEKEKI